MELAFATRSLRTLCEDDVRAWSDLPNATVVQLRDRLADIDAEEAMSDLAFGQPRFDAAPPGRVRFELPAGYELVCVSNHPEPPVTGDGSADFSRVRRMKVIKVGKVG